MPTLYLTEDYALVRRNGEDCLLVQIPERRAKDGETPSPARKERVPLLKMDEVVVLGEVTLTASAIHMLLDPAGKAILENAASRNFSISSSSRCSLEVYQGIE